MRVLPVVVSLLCLAVPLHALARPKPKIAVAPFHGDPDGKIAEAVVDALAGKHFAVVPPDDVRRERKQLGLSDKLNAASVRKLSTSLEVIAIIDGTVRKSARKRSLRLDVHRRDKRATGFTIEFKTTDAATFHRSVRDQILNRLDRGSVPPSNGDGDDEDTDRLTVKRGEDDDDSDRKRKPTDDDDDSDRKRTSDADDGDGDRKRKLDADGGDRKRKLDAEDRERITRTDEPARKRKSGRGNRASTAFAVARAGAGLSLAQRKLTYDTRSGFMQTPPSVDTTAGSGRVDGELYPLALTDPSSSLAALGLAASYDRTFGLSIKIPNQTLRAPIDQAHYTIGARYRLALGDNSITAGLDYVRRRYIADRSSLMAVVLDAPDVDYSAVAPVVAARVPITPTVTAIGALDALLMLETGPIQSIPSYGPATAFGLEAQAGVDVAITAQLALRVLVEYSRIRLTFTGTGEMARSRDNDTSTQDVNSATDRSLGIAATLCLVY